MKQGFAIVAGLVLSLAFAGAGAADDHVALLKNVTGRVHILRGADDLLAAPGSVVLLSDEVSSEKGASAGLVFKDGTLLTLGSSSSVKVRDYVFEPAESRYAFSVFLAKGQAIYSSGKIGKIAPESVKVDTPTSTVGVRGTRFIVVAE
jgi:ferric-dicitrate binding protein FerR (iron transport regulator)